MFTAHWQSALLDPFKNVTERYFSISIGSTQALEHHTNCQKQRGHLSSSVCQRHLAVHASVLNLKGSFAIGSQGGFGV